MEQRRWARGVGFRSTVSTFRIEDIVTSCRGGGGRTTLLGVIQELYSFGDRGHNPQDEQKSLAEDLLYRHALLT